MEHSTKPKSFNYCFWAKLLVAIPAIPIIALMAASYATNPALQVAIAVFAVALTLYAAKKIDSMPCFARMVVKKNHSAK